MTGQTHDGFGSKMNVTCRHFAMGLLQLLVMKLGGVECVEEGEKEGVGC